mmetsp:Transcript_39811/g.112956  ORF Transcript_39811/g.112956 Transcript_39811/m.112956 type:complete len:904 (+) Transcript_39811:561-3272(+)
MRGTRAAAAVRGAIVLLVVVLSHMGRSTATRLQCGTNDEGPTPTDNIAMSFEIQFSSSVNAEALELALDSDGQTPADLADRVIQVFCGIAWSAAQRCTALDWSWDNLPAFQGIIEMDFNHACSIVRFVNVDKNLIARLEHQMLKDVDGLGLLPIMYVSAELYQLGEPIPRSGQPSAVEQVSEPQDKGSQLTIYQAALMCISGVLVVSLVLFVVAWKKGWIKSGVTMATPLPSPELDIENRSGNWVTRTKCDPSSTNLYDRSPRARSDRDGGSSASDCPSLAEDQTPKPHTVAVVKDPHGSSTVKEAHGFPSGWHSYCGAVFNGIHGSGSFMCSQASSRPGDGHLHGLLGVGKSTWSAASGSSDGKRGAVNAAIMGQLKVDFQALKIEEEIGSGNFKIVYRGRWNGTAVAIVKMQAGGMVTEARIMQKLGTHPNLVQFYRWARDTRGSEYMIMELLQHGSLYQLLSSDHGLDFADKLKICVQICCAMCELRKEGLLHCDLAARNVLVANTDPPHVKVADFGLAREWQALGMGGNNQRRILDCLPLRWTPPEVFRDAAWSEKSDVWTFGVTMWEIFSNAEEPYVRELGDADNVDIVWHIMQGNHLAQPQECPDQIYCLMTDCWCYEPENRPTFEHLLERFKGIHANFARRPQLFQHRTTLTGQPSTLSLEPPGSGRPSLVSCPPVFSHGALLDAVLHRHTPTRESTHGYMVTKYLNSSHDTAMQDPHGTIVAYNPSSKLCAQAKQTLHGTEVSNGLRMAQAPETSSSPVGEGSCSGHPSHSKKHPPVGDSSGYTSIPTLVADAKLQQEHMNVPDTKKNPACASIPSVANPGYTNIRDLCDGDSQAGAVALPVTVKLAAAPRAAADLGYANIRDLVDIPGPPTEFLPAPDSPHGWTDLGIPLSFAN